MAESSNKNLIRIIKRTIEDNQRCWHTKLRIALWVDRITPKRAIGNSPFMLVYGKEARLPISLEFPSFELAHQLELLEEDAMKIRLAKLIELEEKRQQAINSLDDGQLQVKKTFGKKAMARTLKEGDLVLKWDVDQEKVERHSNFDSL